MWRLFPGRQPGAGVGFVASTWLLVLDFRILIGKRTVIIWIDPVTREHRRELAGCERGSLSLHEVRI